MHFYAAKCKQAQEELLYRVYMTDSIKALVGNETRYADLIMRSDKENADTRSADEIKSDIKSKLRRLGNGYIQSGSKVNS